ncbi:MICOS complex subunit Mic12 family protein [Aspergillus clavatus NRRL 1]|uniref:MICOS complex subunit MIC12 n=1 Tax=Aspergillus clavatus (strain ATCC 1007 / CBS 513.65 / DSM 816 / NCTC 3887 / NRRL 1 / QM 1276 / 107) TaxID=344612 RepID=A1CQH0_ASPCL|nr:uncharacterized protein ACLA_026080 [Aspergillus clavatus NRRL 1]EAW07891.1 conserved hypothetical protein [Aspergillus clavatus NRRL 1]
MGFFVGFVHRANRLEQSTIIREQTRALNWIASPVGAWDRRLAPRDQPPLDPEQSKPSQPALKDFLKHRWNKELETFARKAYEARWEDARDTAVAGWKAAIRLVKKE